MSPVAQLFHRLSAALGGFDVTPEERQQVLSAWTAAGGQEEATWEKLPADIRKLVEEIEKRDPQSWDDPADLPHQKGL